MIEVEVLPVMDNDGNALGWFVMVDHDVSAEFFPEKLGAWLTHDEAVRIGKEQAAKHGVVLKINRPRRTD